jgi:small subunit ribosomal protein S17e|tara:strand:+ start:541 stop:729 length:189 start_codon:yes stop_codon:yes gene_type:complete
MGRIRQKDIKNTANELINRFSDDLGTDFKENRKFIKSVLRVQGKLLMNRISGYVTHIVKIKK